MRRCSTIVFSVDGKQMASRAPSNSPRQFTADIRQAGRTNGLKDQAAPS